MRGTPFTYTVSLLTPSYVTATWCQRCGVRPCRISPPMSAVVKSGLSCTFDRTTLTPWLVPAAQPCETKLSPAPKPSASDSDCKHPAVTPIEKKVVAPPSACEVDEGMAFRYTHASTEMLPIDIANVMGTESSRMFICCVPPLEKLRLIAAPVKTCDGQKDTSGTDGDESLGAVELPKSPAAAEPVASVRGTPTDVSESARLGCMHAPVVPDDWLKR